MSYLISAENGNSTQTGRTSRYPPSLLVGRSREQAALRDALATAVGGHGRLVLLGGEAGIGKTSLAQELVNAVASEPATVLIGRCYDLMSTPPYGPWRDLFDGYRPAPAAPPPPATFAGDWLEQVTDQAALFGEVRRFFRELSADRPVLILLEDLHWSDPASLELLRNVAAHLRLWPVLLLVTYRADELTRRHPLTKQLPALVREAAGLRLDLRRLDRDALQALADGRYHLARADEDRLVAYLEQHAEGNPFFATELLRALEEDGIVRPSDDRWTLGDLDQVTVPLFLRQVIEGRVARLGDVVREPLAMAAVIGQEVPLDLWGTVAELDEGALLTIVEQAVEAHLLEAEQDGAKVRFVHALTREALYEAILPPRRRLWHRKVADALLDSPQPDPDAVAYHLQQAGDPRAWEWLVTAGDRAQRAYAWLAAAERLLAAAALLDGVEGQERTRCRLSCRVGWLLRFSDPIGAMSTVEDAFRIATQLGDELRAAELGWVRATLLFYSDRFRAAIAAIIEAKQRLDALESSPPVASPMPTQIWFSDALPAPVTPVLTENGLAGERFSDYGQRFRQGNLLWAFASSGRPTAEFEGLEEFVTLADVPGTRGRILPVIAFTHHALGIVYAARGNPVRARATWTRARELFAAFDHHALTALTLLNELRDVGLTYGAAVPADWRGLAAAAEAALGRAGGALRPGVTPRLGWLACFTVDGRWPEADQILDMLPSPGNAYLRREVTGTRAVLARHRGQTEDAWAEIHPLFPRGPTTEPGDLIHQEGLFLQRLAADLCLDAGDLLGASAWLVAHDTWLDWSACELGRAEGQAAWARWHWASGDGIAARAAADAALSLAAAPDQPLVWLAIHRLLGEIDTAAGEYAAADGHLAAAIELADACEAPFERALTLLVLAELRAASGNGDEALTHLDEVRRICFPLGAAPTLVRAEALAARLTARPSAEQYPGGLTRREVEVLQLLPRGLSNSEIAETLFLSPRTVQTHLTNIYGKLGVGGRAGAVAFAMARGLT